MARQFDILSFCFHCCVAAAPECLPRKNNLAALAGWAQTLTSCLHASTLVLIRFYAYLGAFLGLLIEALSFF